MSGMMGKEITGGTRLVLGFDAGCFTCDDLARRIEERVGDKLSVENLNDPRLLAWREEALGKDTKWAPTLFEIDGEKVLRAWSGWKMGWALSHSIGVAATWQVMQALGEVGAVPKVEDSRLVEKMPPKAAEAAVGMSRGQFLKGVGGAAVAMSVLGGGTLVPSVAEAATSTGTAEQQRLAKSIVRNSRQFKALAAQQAQVGARFDFSKAVVKVSKGRAAVSVPSGHRRMAVAATFIVILRRALVIHYRHMVFGTPGDEKWIRITDFLNGTPLRSYYKTVIGDNYVVTEDNRIVSHQQFKRELERYSQQNASFQAQSISQCRQDAEEFCNNWIVNGACTGFGVVVGVALAPVSGPGGIVGGAAAGFACTIAANKSGGCASMARSQCAPDYSDAPPPIKQQPPTYYCK